MSWKFHIIRRDDRAYSLVFGDFNVQIAEAATPELALYRAVIDVADAAGRAGMVNEQVSLVALARGLRDLHLGRAPNV